MLSRSRCAIALLLLCVGLTPATADQWDAPSGFYDAATGTGSTLKTQLRTIMSSGHIQRSYGDFRNASRIFDADPNRAGNILLVYNRASVSGSWDSGRTWNREHVWPQSKQPGSASNGTTGNLGDPHALRPSNPTINSQRGNQALGGANLTGSNRDNGSYYFPGDFDKGDVARSLFYSSTRYSLTLSNGSSGPGDLASLLAWHYLDTPDEFERTRNHKVYSSTYNPSYYTNNRNAFVDRPEYVWSVFADQQNDSQLYFGGAPAANGGSSLDVDFGSVIVGASLASSTSVTLNKAGQDGTYYEVSTSGDATSSVSGRYNAFAIDSSGSDSESWTVGLDFNSSTVGDYSGQVVVDNLDVTTQGGAGRGANDANDIINLSASVLDHAHPSFSSGGDLYTLSYDFGDIDQGATSPLFDFDLFNLESLLGPTAGLDVDDITESGDLGSFILVGDETPTIAAGESSSYLVGMDTTALGDFGATFTFSLSDEDLPGASSLASLTLSLTGSVVAAGLPGDYNGDLVVDAADYIVWRNGGSPDSSQAGYEVWESNYGQTAATTATVPEPTAWLLAMAGVAALAVRK